MDRIQTDHIQLLMRQTIDMAVHAACNRHRRELPEGSEGLTYRIATAAAQAAVEQFAAYCNMELALIRSDHETRLQHEMMRPPSPMLVSDEPR